MYLQDINFDCSRQVLCEPLSNTCDVIKTSSHVAKQACTKACPSRSASRRDCVSIIVVLMRSRASVLSHSSSVSCSGSGLCNIYFLYSSRLACRSAGKRKLKTIVLQSQSIPRSCDHRHFCLTNPTATRAGKLDLRTVRFRLEINVMHKKLTEFLTR